MSDKEYFAAGKVVTNETAIEVVDDVADVTPMKSGGFLFRSPIDLCVNEESTRINNMIQIIHRCTFIDCGVVHDTVDVESGANSITPSDKAKKRKWLYRTMNQQRQTTHDIVGNTISYRPVSSLLDVLNVVDSFLRNN